MNKIEFDLDIMGSLDIQSMHKVIDAYRQLDNNEWIMEGGTGFNTNSGYVYIALENGISICSCFGQSVDYLVTDYETGEEEFFDTYEEAEEQLKTINK
ncbi:MAG: hypothetical protein Unbinned4585contig1001_45 [Prokaryotic dsDNA virus sp.]|nr:MAG: hypothetical protein Unbinned4585contig1001_45 [Prokaryotic dsDNA virus sp.]|tara:strand:+ start:8381 stop:8674 length:294 start_codon:yes stop_codon:yes gene_type:complete